MTNEIETTTNIFGHTVKKELGDWYKIYDASGAFVGSAMDMGHAFKIISNRVSCEYSALKPHLVRLLKDYLQKLERDDYDPDAIGKMKEVNYVLDTLQGRM